MAVKFFKNKKTLVRVTSMVQDRVKVTDASVARVYKGTVLGVAPGRTEVQVRLAGLVIMFSGRAHRRFVRLKKSINFPSTNLFCLFYIVFMFF